MATMATPLKGLYRLAGYTYFNTIADSVEPTVGLIVGAETELVILTGELCPALWNHPKIREALAAVTGRANAPRIEIIFGPAAYADPTALAFLKSLALERKVALHETRDRQQAHFMVADRLNLKVEDPHKPNADRRTGYVSCDQATLAERLHTRFDLIKQMATPVVA